MSTRWRLPILATAVLIAGTAAGGGTMALWKTAGKSAPSTIIAGDLDVTAGTTTWTESSADVADTPRTIDPETFRVRQGDTVTMTQNFAVHVAGDNVVAQIAVDWVDPAGLPAGVTAAYDVRDASGVRLGAHTPVGRPVTLGDDRLTSNDAGADDEFSVAITLDFAGLDDRFGAESPAQVADLGRFSFTLEQVRGTRGRP